MTRSRPIPGSRRDGADGETSLLRFLVQSAADLNSSLKLEEVFAKVAERVRPLVDCHLFCVMLWNERNQLLEHSFSLCFGKQVPIDGGFPLGHGISGIAALERRPIRVADVRKHPGYVRHRHPEVEILSELAVPLLLKGRLIGVIDLESVEVEAFNEEHEQVLSALAAHVAIAIENARLYERVLAEERRLGEDLRLAREIQKGLMPRRGPHSEVLDIGAAYLAARTVGGDFYDFIPYGDDRLAVVAGDVSGKGAPAALYGSLAVGLMRGQLLERSVGPAETMRLMNERLVVSGFENRFVAMAFGIFDEPSRTLALANSGFTRPVLHRGGDVRRIMIEGTPMGILPGLAYDETRLELRSGDVVAFCSDGLHDAVDGDGEHFGDHGLAEVLGHLRTASAQQIADGILRANTAYAGEHEEHPDDRSVVVLKVR